MRAIYRSVGRLVWSREGFISHCLPSEPDADVVTAEIAGSKRGFAAEQFGCPFDDPFVERVVDDIVPAVAEAIDERFVDIDDDRLAIDQFEFDNVIFDVFDEMVILVDAASIVVSGGIFDHWC